jgi:hypothetical protein
MADNNRVQQQKEVPKKEVGLLSELKLNISQVWAIIVALGMMFLVVQYFVDLKIAPVIQEHNLLRENLAVMSANLDAVLKDNVDIRHEMSVADSKNHLFIKHRLRAYWERLDYLQNIVNSMLEFSGQMILIPRYKDFDDPGPDEPDKKFIYTNPNEDKDEVY